jgi:hypothetical protein
LRFRSKYVAGLISAFRQISAAGMRSDACFGMDAYWASENLDALIVLRSPGWEIFAATQAKNDPFFEVSDQRHPSAHGN